MNKSLPNKHIRLAVYNAINNIVVDSITIPCFDTRITTDGQTDPPFAYVLMSTQTNEVDKQNKCEYFWDSSILLDIIVHYDGAGNTGSRLFIDNILDEVRNQLQNLALTGALEIVWMNMSFPADITSETSSEIIYRKFLRLEMKIK